MAEKELSGSPGMIPMFVRAGVGALPGASRLPFVSGGGKDLPVLEGVKVNGRWAVIYSKYDIGCALERHQGLDCKGYTYESAMRIASSSGPSRRCVVCT